jgi:hypothetical protein
MLLTVQESKKSRLAHNSPLKGAIYVLLRSIMSGTPALFVSGYVLIEL